MEDLKVNIPEGYEIDKENSTFECIKFKKKKNDFPTSWEEYLQEFCKCPTAIKDKVSLLTENFEQKYAALYKLELLRDCWRQDWKPDYDGSGPFYVIYKIYKENWAEAHSNIHSIIINKVKGIKLFLCFENAEKCEKFLKCFMSLILEAGDLI